jgi:hypothetical protein
LIRGRPVAGIPAIKGARPMNVRIDRDLALAKKTDTERWANPDALEPAWDARAQRAATLIPAGSRVLDLGCGRMMLRGFLPAGCSYQGCDIVARDPDTIVCDFNAGQFPHDAAQQADVISMLGVLEYIVDADGFFAQLRQSPCKVVMSYCVTDLTAGIDRASLGWINHYSLAELGQLIARHRFAIEQATQFDHLQVLMRLAAA